ncbi:hypothetical protein PMG11_06419 [Penicillium brasilianum]|uniref:AB hydrolase-1 domain-containing protein n=1 Tax=Penicillium brasilianum TaxID=104259 RepID=A0A0F7TM38_PENBI|nr:hypothetical protein PMG11_06419 [Penicillium brasilianum]
MNPTLAFPQAPTMRTYHHPTPTGQIYILDSNPSPSNTPPHPTPKPTLLLIHGNSSCIRIWHPLLTSTPLTQTHRVLALDLPGHGCSDDASTPGDVYTMHGYAGCILDLLTTLDVHRFSVLGWSLGGHVALEMLSLIRSNPSSTSKLDSKSTSGSTLETEIDIKGVMLVGTPPSYTRSQVARAFTKDPPCPALPLASKDTLTTDEICMFATAITGPPFESWQVDAVARTDGVSRETMFVTFAAGGGVDQVGVVEDEAARGDEGVVFSVVNGVEDPFINLDYVDGLGWGRLVGGECVRMEGLGHTPFWEDVERFFPYLMEFLGVCEK